MRGDHPFGGLGVFLVAPLARQHEFLVLLEHRELADLAQIPAKSLFRTKGARARFDWRIRHVSSSCTG